MSSREITISTSRLLSSDAEHDGSLAHLGHGVVAGVMGASIVAIIFLVIDAMTARAFATPNALGQALFMGQTFLLDRELMPVAIFGYTALHTAVFVGIAYFGAALVSATYHRFSAVFTTILVGSAMFLACQAGIMSFAYVASFPTGEFDAVRVGYANFFAAMVMARFLVWLVEDDSEAESTD